MSTSPLEVDLADLIREVTSLRKGEGMTPTKLSRSPALLSVCGATHADPHGAWQRVVEALDALENRRSARALRAALGLDNQHAGDRVDSRRRAFAKTVGRKKDAVKNWEDDAIEEVALILLGTSPLTPVPAAIKDVHHAFVMENLEITARYDKRGCFVETLQTRKVISLIDNADGFIYATHNNTRLTVLRGGALTELDHQPNGAVRHKVVFSRPLMRGESTEFAFREVEIDCDDPRPDEDRVSQLFHIPTRRFWVQAQFAGNAPAVAWRFDKMTYFERPGQPTKANRLRAEDGRLTAEFTNLFGGLASGIAWRW